MAEQNVNITQGTGVGVDTFNVGPGSVGSGTEAIRQVVSLGDPHKKSGLAPIDDLDGVSVNGPLTEGTGREVLRELKLLRLAFCDAFGRLYLESSPAVDILLED
jgi:hypothetical protein